MNYYVLLRWLIWRTEQKKLNKSNKIIKEKKRIKRDLQFVCSYPRRTRQPNTIFFFFNSSCSTSSQMQFWSLFFVACVRRKSLSLSIIYKRIPSSAAAVLLCVRMSLNKCPLDAIHCLIVVFVFEDISNATHWLNTFNLIFALVRFAPPPPPPRLLYDYFVWIPNQLISSCYLPLSSSPNGSTSFLLLLLL